MKRPIIFTLLVLTCTIAQAQFTVTADGKLFSRESDGSPILASRKAYLESDSTTLYLFNQKSVKSSLVSYGLCSDNIMSKDTVDGGYHYGVCGHVFSEDYCQNNAGKAFGVWGGAGNATPGYNYGVFGKLGQTSYRIPGIPHFVPQKVLHGNFEISTQGAAIYGTVYPNDYGSYINGTYAGYFNGNVEVSGNLNVTGNINGVILGPSTESSYGDIVEESLYDAESKGQSITDKLASITAASYLLPTTLSSRKASENLSDSAEVNNEMNIIEVQNLTKKHYALYAEQLEKFFPDLVYENEDGSKSINYIEIIPLLVQSIAELSDEVNKLRGENTKYKSKYSTGIDEIKEENLSMGQNMPNPWKVSTKIPMNIPENIKSARLYIYDLSGKQLLDIPVTKRGNFTHELFPDGLVAGMYIYTLIAENSVVATKRMILTK